MDKPAFPHTRVHPDTSGRLHDGLSRRELIAAMAMQGMLSGDATSHHEGNYPEIAGCAIKVADALIAALEDDK